MISYYILISVLLCQKPNLGKTIVFIPHGIEIPKALVLLKAARTGIDRLLTTVVRPQKIAQIISQRKRDAVSALGQMRCQLHRKRLPHQLAKFSPVEFDLHAVHTSFLKGKADILAAPIKFLFQGHTARKEWEPLML